MLTSSGADYAPNEHKKWQFGDSPQNPFYVVALTSSSGANYIVNEHEYEG